MNARHRIGQILTSLASVAGIPLSIILLLIHVKTQIGDTDGAAELCTASSTVDCSVAATSHYSEIAGIPIAAIGLAFYVAALVVGMLSPMLVPATDKKEDAFVPAYLLVGVYTLAVLDSVYLGIVNFTQLEKVCDKCVWLYGVNFLGFIGAGLWAAGNPLTAVSNLLRRLPQTIASAASLVFVITFAAALAGTAWQSNKMAESVQQEEEVPTLTAEPADDSLATHLYRDGAATLGPDDALVRIVEFSDFQCPYCAVFAGMVEQLAEKYPDTVQITFRNFPLPMHPQARRVAEMGVCAQSQRKFWEFSSRAFRQQETMYDDFSDDTLIDLAEQVGMNPDEAKDCLHSAFASTSIDQDLEDANALELRGTPSVFINEQAYEGRLELDALERTIDKIIKEVQEDQAQHAEQNDADDNDEVDADADADADADGEPTDAEEDSDDDVDEDADADAEDE